MERYEYDKDCLLRPDEVSVYVFAFDEETSGYKIREVEVTEEDEISQEEFVRIHEALYEEAVKLRRDLGAGN